MAKERADRAGLDRERTRRQELDRSRAEERKRAPKVDTPLRPELPTASTLSPATATERLDSEAPATGVRQPGQHVECAWCGAPTPVKSRGPLPRFCSANCRHRAWEQERAARDGRAAVATVDRFIATYPGDAEAWVKQLDWLAIDVRDGRLAGELLIGPLDAVSAAIAFRERDDRGQGTLVATRGAASFRLAQRGRVPCGNIGGMFPRLPA